MISSKNTLKRFMEVHGFCSVNLKVHGPSLKTGFRVTVYKYYL